MCFWCGEYGSIEKICTGRFCIKDTLVHTILPAEGAVAQDVRSFSASWQQCSFWLNSVLIPFPLAKWVC